MKENFNHIKNSLEITPHGSGYSRESLNYQYILEHILQEIKVKLNELFPNYFTNRKRRGLVNFLGGVVKAITGNLDAEDGQRYEETLQKLEAQQTKQKILAEKQISLTVTAIEKFNTTISKLTTNQATLKEKIIQLEAAANNRAIQEADTYTMLNLYTIYIQMITVSNSMLRVIEELETAITFAKMSVLHPSIIQPEDFLNELRNIQKHIRKITLPYAVNKSTILLFEKITKIKAYQKATKFVFILEIPLIEPTPYMYYHLYSFPMLTNQNLFQFIIPKNKFLFINEYHYMLSNSECQETTPEEYMCPLPEVSSLHPEMPCEVQLIQFTQNYSNCNPKLIKMKNKKIQKISANQWIIISPNETTITKICNIEEKEVIQGSYILKIPSTCQIRIDNTILQIHEDSKIQTKIVNIPQLNFKIESTEKKNPTKIDPIELESINLDDMNSIRNNMNNGLINLQEEKPIISSHLSYWTIFIYLSILAAAMFLLWKKCLRRKNNINIPIPEERNIPIEELRIRN